jgi:hypothetical protein
MAKWWNKIVSWFTTSNNIMGCKKCNHECHCNIPEHRIDCLTPGCKCVGCEC